MKKNILHLLTAGFLLLLSSCVNQGPANNDNNNIDKKIRVNSHLLTVTSDSWHIYNRPGQKDRLILAFNPDQLRELLKANAQPQLEITAEIADGAALINLDNSKFDHIVVKDGAIAPIITNINTSCKESGNCAADGRAVIKFFVNGVEQDSDTGTASVLVSERSIQFEDLEQEHYPEGEGSVRIYANHIAAADKFTIKLEGQELEIKNNSCSFSGTSPKTPCTVSYRSNKGATSPLIRAQIDDNSNAYQHDIILCNGPQLQFYALIDPVYISATDKLHNTVQFAVHRSCVSNAAVLPVTLSLQGVTINTDKKIADYIQVPLTVEIPAGTDQEVFSAHLNKDEAHPELHLGDNFIITPTIDAQYGKFNINPSSITTMIRDTAQSAIELQEMSGARVTDPLQLKSNDTKIVAIIRQRIDSAQLSFKLLDNGHEVDSKIVKLEFSPEQLRLEAKEIQQKATYSLYATNGGKPVNINGLAFLTVSVAPRPEPVTNFQVLPNQKHILKDYPQDEFYIKVLKTGVNSKARTGKQLKDNAENAYLYAIEPQAGGCKNLAISKITVDANNQIKEDSCTLADAGSMLAQNCSCDNDTLDNKSCIFKIKTPETYQADQMSCDIKIKTNTVLELGAMSINSTSGRKPIVLISKGAAEFNNAAHLELWSQYHNKQALASNEILNYHWTTAVNADTLKGSELFQDQNLLQPLTVKDFVVNDSAKTVTIKRYPGRNTLGQAVTLPKIRFIMQYNDGKGNNYWQDDDRCIVNENLSGLGISTLPNLGCNTGGHTFNFLHGEAYIPQGLISISDKDELKVNGDQARNLVIPEPWKDSEVAKLKTYGIEVDNSAAYQLALKLSN